MKALSSCDRTSPPQSLFPKCITLQATRLSHSLSQRDIEEKTGINDGYIYQFEQGKCKPWPAAIAKLCSLFEVAQLDLFPELEESRKSCEPPYPPCKTLKAARQQAGLNQSQLAIAASIGIAPNYLSLFEKGHRKPWRSVAQKLCAYFEMSQDELFPELARPISEIVVWDDDRQECITQKLSA
ncbi:MAG TPA: helix-turn-helix transcriptional regulator [Coleofasciculaceae cyanobacterium]